MKRAKYGSNRTKAVEVKYGSNRTQIPTTAKHTQTIEKETPKTAPKKQNRGRPKKRGN